MENIFEMMAEITKPVTEKTVIQHCIQNGIITDILFNGIDHKDSPDYSDAFITSASLNGEQMTDYELDLLNENSDLVHELLTDYLL